MKKNYALLLIFGTMLVGYSQEKNPNNDVSASFWKQVIKIYQV